MACSGSTPMTADGYPDEDDLRRIAAWPHEDFGGLLDFVRERWMYASVGYWKADAVLGILNASTGGWSGNESLVAALGNNRMFWTLCWISSRRGGHYEFDLTRVAKMSAEAR